MFTATPRVGIYTLGCKVNQYESEAIAELFEQEGFSVLPPTQICDAYVINTCTVTAESDRKARQFIRRAIKHNPNAIILVIGCYAQVSPEQVREIKGVDFIGGNLNKSRVVDAAKALLQSGKPSSPQIVSSSLDQADFEAMRITRFDRTRAYIKIEDGCENHCAYCIIPAARGKVRSKLPQDVLNEVRELTENGCREIVLTGIETASYGKDLGNYTLADLLCEIDRIPNVERIRLGSLDPSLIKQSFVDRIAGLRSLTPHFHLSMQSGSDKVLALMKRKYNTRMALEAMQRLRQAIPDVQFTTDMIVGFPQESSEDFETTLRFIKEARFLMIHVFPYSRRAGTVADGMPGQIAEEIKHERVRRLTEFQAEIKKELLNEQTNRSVTVLFETFRNGIGYGHTPNFIEVACPVTKACHAQALPVTITGNNGDICNGTIISN